jgi:O-antigen ligase
MRDPAGSIRRGGVRATVTGRERARGTMSPALLYSVYLFWILMTFEFDQFLSVVVGGPFFRIPMVLVAVLGVAVLVRGGRRALYWPLVLFVAMHFVASLVAENAGLSRIGFKFMLYVLVLFASCVSFLDSPASVVTVLRLYLLHFIWYAVQGIPGGRVGWHTLLANEDSYGPLMVMAIPFSYFFGQASPPGRWRWIARLTLGLSLLGVVVSFARGAAVAAGVVLLFMLARSPHRVRALVGLVAVAIAIAPVAGMLIDIDAYMAEINSSKEGDQGRLDVWKLAWDVFCYSPIYGVGAGNFGVVASMITVPDATRATGADPSQLYSMWTHNAFMQVLAEEGLIGILLWGAMVIGFFRRNSAARGAGAHSRWQTRGGEGIDPRAMSLGLDGAMIGWLVCSIFYNQLYIHWFWSMFTMSDVLARLTTGDGATVGKRMAG